MKNPPAERIVQTHESGILYEPSRLGKSRQKAAAQLFEPSYWAGQAAGREMSGGRGGVLFIHTADCAWVLRHYRRGGLAAKVSADRYLWCGADRTRSFREWRLLAHLHVLGLPVPAPVAARYVRHGLTCTADLITEQVPDAQSLAQALAGDLKAELWRSIGATLAQFHRAGAHHADLNAHNILLSGATPQIFLLDFDRGELRQPGRWQDAVLQRLLRSLRKVQQERGALFADRDWGELLLGYERELTAGNSPESRRPIL